MESFSKEKHRKLNKAKKLEIDGLVQKIYEDSVKRKISDDRRS